MSNVPFFFDGERKVFASSAANRTTALAAENPGARYQEIGGSLYESNGLAWNQISTSGAAHVTDPSYTLVKYTGSGYTYLCEAVMGTARSTALWRVTRITDTTGDIVYAGVAGTTAGTFAFAATDLATVAALTYTLGA